ncbi:MAG TPA: PadR family transcriptional regulator [Erysipelotrichaceae bacterium]|nr:PadR family transcriptional regulator [Erysipelotrichaceae bacterium]
MNAQFKKGVLELVVLAQLKSKDQYGYQLTETISKSMDVATGTLYLILKRLKDEGYFETYLVETAGGPARKYYRLTDAGKDHYDSMKKGWFDFVFMVEHLIENEKGNNNE